MTISAPFPHLHPGKHIKKNVLPEGLSVKKAAELIGVGRPALSNLLNGNAALTPEMAMRIEKTFGARAQELLALQTAYDEFQHREQAKEIAVRTYVQTFLAITARNISAWSEQIHARAELPALLRRLVNSTGDSLAKVDFPAFDNSQRPGWDGYVSTNSTTPWIPRGESGWEFGCNRNSAQKAEDDYSARTGSIAPEERKAITFVFVTPRNWPGKDEWVKAKRKTGAWKDVRAYDASDLEQWLEQSVATQAWFAGKLGNGADGIATLDDCWKEWAEAAEPPLSKILFRTAVEAAKDKFQTWLTQPPAGPFVITADSKIEGLAFVACALEALGKTPREFYDRALVLKTVEALKRTTTAAPDFVAIVSSPEIELASAGLHKTHHLLILRRRNDVSGEPDIALDLVDDATYREALTAMGLPDEDYQRYARETGNSPTILRRRLSPVPAIREPAWSTDKTLARKLIPLNFAGVWSSDTGADQEIMSLLAGTRYADIEMAVAELRTTPDAPMWSIGKFRGVTSKIDVLFATHALFTKDDLENFFFVAHWVLSESDPALELPPDQQWAANIYGKTRQHSAALRRGLCETLVLLAAHGNHLFRERLGIDIQARVDGVVRSLLLPLDTQTWASQKGDLPHYAEAAPDVFLEILEQDLASDAPKVHELLRPADSVPFGGCPRTGLLWALETLAWNPDRLLRVSFILAKLAAVRIDDNWANKPEGSLESIYRCWMPQTAASIDERNKAMEVICRLYPDIGWLLCLEQFGTRNGIGHYSSRPLWRNDAVGAGQTAKTWDEIWRVSDKARELALTWPQQNENTLGDLVERLEYMPEADQETPWSLIKIWAASAPSDMAKHTLRERVRKSAFTRRARIRGVAGDVKDRAREAYALLAPSDLVVRHLWLFAEQWVDESSDELEDEEFDYHQREARIAALRKAALDEIWREAAYDGIMRLCGLGNAESAIGWQLAGGVIAPAQWQSFLDRLSGQGAPPAELKIDNLLSGFLGRLDADARCATLSALLEDLAATDAADKAIRLLKCAPFRAETWAHLEALPEEWRQRYWRETYVRWERQDESEINTLVECLLDVQRPRAAFSAVHMEFDKVDTKRLVTLLRTIATSEAEPAGRFQLAHHDVSNAFKSLAARADTPRDELAQLEFMYVTALDHSAYGIPTLEDQLAQDPRLFLQLVALVYRRTDGEQDPAEWSIPDDERRRAAATTAYNVLNRARRIPGTDEHGTIAPIALHKWVDDARALGRLHGRGEVIDHLIGKLLGKSPPGTDGIWPCEPIRQALDAFASQDIADGMSAGRRNARGAHWRGEGGSDERGLAAQYRSWSKAVLFQYPFTAKFLEDLARSYDHEAVWHDTDASVRKRLSY